MKILSIGNSFSQDAHRWLTPLAESLGVPLQAVNLYIGGCSLQRHWENALSGQAVYQREENGRFTRWTSLEDALEEGDWDVITLQQASPLSGQKESYLPYLTDLFALVRRHNPAARVLLHQTWAYDANCTWEGFANYGNSTGEMHRRVAEGYAYAAGLIGVGLIPVGEVIRRLRQTELPDREPLTRDGAHLSHIYGRYAAALTWAGFLTDRDVRKATFVPSFEGYEGEECHLSLIRRVVYDTLKK